MYPVRLVPATVNGQCKKVNRMILGRRHIRISSIPVVLLAFTLLSIAQLSQAQIYKWVDEHGKTHFTDNPPKNVQSDEVELKINTYTSVEITPLVERLGRKDKVVLYSATWCGFCKKARAHFRQNDIPYVEYDVEKNRIGRMDYKLLKGSSVPIILVGTRRMNGFRASRFDRLYKQEILAPQQPDALVDADADDRASPRHSPRHSPRPLGHH